ncbi:MAG: hypothetical protein ABIQ16_22515 [Polyangiaceae bacterium]
MRFVLGWVILANSALGCGGHTQGSGEPSGTSELNASAWDVTVVATPTATDPAPQDSPKSPVTFHFTLDLIGEPTNLWGALSRSGTAVGFSLARGTDGSLSLGDTTGATLQLGGFDNSIMAITFDTLTLSAGSALVGGGAGKVNYSCGDCSYDEAVAFTLSGEPDHSAPQLSVPSVAVNPLDRVSLPVSEALPSANLALSGTSSIQLDFVPSQSEPREVIHSLPMHFETAQILPFSGAWNIIGEAKDFANHALDLGDARLTTLADPGIFVADGFESSTVLTAFGTGTVIDARRGLPIPSGSHALLLEPGTSATFHLRRSVGQHQVTATVIELSKIDGATPWGAFEAGVIGGTERATLRWGSSLPATPTSDSAWPNAGPVTHASATLTDTGSDVVVRLAPAICLGLCPPAGALILDDLKVE